MRPRNETDPRPVLAGLLVVVPARDEEDEIEGCLQTVAAAAGEAGAPVVVSVVLHRCTDGTAARVDGIVQAQPDVSWVVRASDADTVGGARAEGVLAGREHDVIASLGPQAVWVASTDADSRVPQTWLAVQRDLADTGADVVLGSVEPSDDGSTPVRLCRGEGVVAEDHKAVRAANLGVRLSAYDMVGGFPATDDREDVQLVHAVRAGAGLPWTSTDRARVLTSARRVGRRDRGFARFLRRLDDTVAGVGADELAARLRLQLLRLTGERGPGKTVCPSEASGAVDPARRRELTPLARAVACTLADEGAVVITQKRMQVDGRTAPGPVRVGLPAATPTWNSDGGT